MSTRFYRRLFRKPPKRRAGAFACGAGGHAATDRKRARLLHGAAAGSGSTIGTACSPNSAQSRWVNEEILSFKRLGREKRILALIVDGETLRERWQVVSIGIPYDAQDLRERALQLRKRLAP